MQIVAFEQAGRYVGLHGCARYSVLSALYGNSGGTTDCIFRPEQIAQGVFIA